MLSCHTSMTSLTVHTKDYAWLVTKPLKLLGRTITILRNRPDAEVDERQTRDQQRRTQDVHLLISSGLEEQHRCRRRERDDGHRAERNHQHPSPNPVHDERQADEDDYLDCCVNHAERVRLDRADGEVEREHERQEGDDVHGSAEALDPVDDAADEYWYPKFSPAHQALERPGFLSRQLVSQVPYLYWDSFKS